MGHLPVGILLASYQVAFCIAAPFTGNCLNRIGRKKAIMVGLLVMSICTVFFASASYFEGKWTFYAISTVGRMVQGVADSLICVAIPSLIAIEFPHKNEKYQGYLEFAMGLGMALGPIMSSFIYDYLAYRGTFFFYAAFIVVFGISAACFIPGKVDRPPKKKKTTKSNDEAEKVPYSIFFKNRRAFLAILVPFIACIFLLYFGPILAPELRRLGVPDKYSGYSLAICWTCYAIGCFIAGFLCQIMPRRYLVLFSILLAALSLFIVGPAKFLPDDVYLIFIGLGLLGFGIAGITVPVLPEMIDAV